MPARRQPQPENEVSRVLLEAEEAAFLFGKNEGIPIQRIAQASSTTITTSDNNKQLDIVGTALARKRATKYVDFVISQMDGVFRVDDEDLDDDCSLVEVPDQVVGFVTGGHGSHLRQLESKWGVITFFAEYTGKLREPFYVCGSNDRTETLLIFGPRYPRRGAQLSAMNVVEEKIPRYYSGASRKGGEMFEGQWCKWKDSADWTSSTMEVPDNLLPYIMGTKGSTLSKLMRASAAVVHPIGSLVYFSGNKQEQKRAREYLTWMLEAVNNPIEVPNLHRRKDATTVMVPADAVGIITGNRRSGLTKMEDEWGVLMLFLGEHGHNGAHSNEIVPLLILAESGRQRKGAELDAMCLVEYKNQGFCTRHLTNRVSDVEGFDVEYWQMNKVEVAYCLGTAGITRRKVSIASGAILQFVGSVCCIGGTKLERKRCREYLEWLLQQMDTDNEAFIDTRGRDDVTEVELRGLKNKAVGVVTGARGKRLRGIEERTGTWCLVAKDHKGVERLCIFSQEAGSSNGDSGRKKAERLFRDALHEASMIQIGRGGPGFQDWNHGKENGKPWAKKEVPKREEKKKREMQPRDGKKKSWYEIAHPARLRRQERKWKEIQESCSFPWKAQGSTGKPWQNGNGKTWNSWEDEQHWEGNGKFWNSRDTYKKPRGRCWEREDCDMDGAPVKEEQSRSRSARGHACWELPETSSTRSPSEDYSSRSSSPPSTSGGPSTTGGHHRPSPRVALRSRSPNGHKFRDKRWRTRSWQM